jgi:L-asparaginase
MWRASGRAMPTARLRFPCLARLGGALAVVGALAGPAVAAAPANIAVLHSAVEAPGDATREGAGEFEVMVSVARLANDHGAVGIVGVGNRHGLFPKGGEHALRFFALRGVPVAKLTRGGDLASDPDGLFLGGSGLNEAQASSVLARCLDRYGPPPAAADPDHPTSREMSAIRAHLAPFQQALALAGAQRVAVQ